MADSPRIGFNKLKNAGGTARQWRTLANQASKSGDRDTARRAKALANMAAKRGGKMGAEVRAVPTSQTMFGGVARATRFTNDAVPRGGASRPGGGSGSGS